MNKITDNRLRINTDSADNKYTPFSFKLSLKSYDIQYDMHITH